LKRGSQAFEKRLSAFNDIALLIGRILIGVLFLVASYNKLKGLGRVDGIFHQARHSGAVGCGSVVAAFELAFGILLVAGFKTRFVAARDRGVRRHRGAVRPYQLRPTLTSSITS